MKLFIPLPLRAKDVDKASYAIDIINHAQTKNHRVIGRFSPDLVVRYEKENDTIFVEHPVITSDKTNILDLDTVLDVCVEILREVDTILDRTENKEQLVDDYLLKESSIQRIINKLRGTKK